MLKLLIAVLIVGAIAYGLTVAIGHFSTEKRAVRARAKSHNTLAATRTKQLSEARRALTKIAANDSGNPALDAQIALQEIDNHELKELES